MCDHYSCILPDSNLQSHQKRRKNIKIIRFRKLDLFVQNGVSLQNRTSSANNDDFNKSIDKTLISGCNVLPHNVLQTNLGLSWGFSSKNHVQTACKFHDLNMDLVV